MPRVIDILGGEDKIGMKLRNRMDFIELARKGIPTEVLSNLTRYLSLTHLETANLLQVNVRTLQRYFDTEHLNSAVTEKVLSIADITARGEEVFGEKSKFLEWMGYPNRIFADRTPLSLMYSRFGSEMVLDELTRIEHGVYA